MPRTKRVEDTIAVDGARIGFRNFSGAAGKFNAAGARNFCVFLETETANTLADKGWNIKWLQPREEEDEPQAYMKVNVRYGSFPPQVMLITGNGKTRLDEDAVGILDWAEFAHIDLVIRPYNYDVNGSQGVSAYLKAMYATLQEDEFAHRYYDVPDSAASSLGVPGEPDFEEE